MPKLSRLEVKKLRSGFQMVKKWPPFCFYHLKTGQKFEIRTNDPDFEWSKLA
jgi:hypothetical protein